MIDPQRLVDTVGGLGVDLFTGVPDSLMEPFCSYMAARLPGEQHIVAANEGAAVGIAIGHYLRTGRPALVYLQNAGFGNTVNPLVSLADPEVYGIPMVLMMGWRGQPGTEDEPQHLKQGRIMVPLLDAMELPWAVLPGDHTAAEACMEEAFWISQSRSSPYLVLVEKGTFAPFDSRAGSQDGQAHLPSREEALIALLDAVGGDGVHVATTGMLGRELYEYRQRTGQSGARDFLTIGGMGHCCSVALGIALADPDREIWCLDGDGSVLMHLGSLAVVAHRAPANYYHVVFNNGVHDSVGGQPTPIDTVDLPELALSLGYRHAATVSDQTSLDNQVEELRAHGGPGLLDLRVRPGNRPGIGRPVRTPAQAKQDFMSGLA